MSEWERLKTWNFWRLSGYELARNEIFLRHKSRRTGAGLVEVQQGGYISDVSHVGDHSRPTPRSAYVIFKSSPLIELPLGHAGGWRC